MIKKNSRVIFYIIALVVFGIFLLLPLLKHGFLVTDDGDWMVIRLSAFYQSFREGQFPVRFLGRLNQNYGYPVANFLYPGFLYIGSFLHFLGFSFQNTVKIILGGSVIIGSIGVFLWLRYFFDIFSSFLGSISYLFMPYLLYDIFKRGSVGEVLAIGIAPFVLYAIDGKNKWLLPLTVGLLAISHNTLAAFFIPTIAFYIILRKKWEMIIPYMIGLGMSLFFWIPAFYEQKYILFSRVLVSNPLIFFPHSLQTIFLSTPLFVATGIVILDKKCTKTKIHWFFLGLVCISIFFGSPLSAFIWKSKALTQFVQFPYRFLALLSIAGPWYIASLGHKDMKQRFVAGILALILIFTSMPYQYSQNVVREEGFFTTNEGTTTVADEYFPKWVSKKFETRPQKKLEFYSGSGRITEHKVTSQTIDITIESTEPSVLQINTIYYPGWGAMLDDSPVIISYSSMFGMMQIKIPSGTHHLFVQFRETASRFMADIASLGFIILYGVYVLISYIPYRKKQKINIKVKRRV